VNAEPTANAAPLVAEPRIVVRGAVSDAVVAYGREKLLHALRLASGPVLAAELRIDRHTDPARASAVHVEMTLDLDGTVVRSRAGAPEPSAAVDDAAERLERRIGTVRHRPQDRMLRHRDRTSWHHEDRVVPRHRGFPRPPEERELVRRKSFTVAAESIEDALFDLERLDHDFFLFRHDVTGGAAVVFRAEAGRYGVTLERPAPDAVAAVGIDLVTGPAPTVLDIGSARALLEASGVPFVFFVDDATDRGCIVYRRDDGHDGLVTPE